MVLMMLPQLSPLQYWFIKTQSTIFFMQLSFNWVTDLESSSILIYFETCKSIYTQKMAWLNGLIKWLIKNGELIKELIKVVARWLHLQNEEREGAAEEVLGGNVWLLFTKFLC